MGMAEVGPVELCYIEPTSLLSTLTLQEPAPRSSTTHFRIPPGLYTITSLGRTYDGTYPFGQTVTRS